MTLRLRTLVLHLVTALLLLTALAPGAGAHDRISILQIDQDYRAEGFVLQWDDSRALPRKLVNATLSDEYRGKASGSAEAIADAYLRAHAFTLFGTESIAIGEALARPAALELRTVRIKETSIGTSVRKQQFVSGVPVEEAIIHVNVDRQGRVTSLFSEFQPGLDLSVSAAIAGDDAQRAAFAAIDRPGATRIEPQTQLVVLAQGGGRLAYRNDLALWAPYGDWRVYIDAQSGEVISVADRMITRKPIAERVEITPHQASAEPTTSSVGKRVTGTGNVLPANPLNNHPERYALRDTDPMIGYVENLSLFRLDGSGFLRGNYADVDNSDQPRTNQPSQVFAFSPDVTNGPFHEANIYWHVDTFQDYIQTTLGINYANNRQMICYAHQGEDDNSSYSPATQTMRFGDGGVDDSEDGEVVLHEYGHAVHDNICGIGGGEAGAISEGFGDYLAATFGNNALVAEWDATSYNPGPPPFLRRTDGTKHYPEDLTGQVHADGEIISAAWWALRGLVGAPTADAIIIASFAGIAATATMEDFADASVQADIAMFGGAHLGAIYNAYGSRGIGPAYLLDITHTPLGDTEDTTGPYAVNVGIQHTSPITGPNAVQLHHKLSTDGAFTAVTMSSSGIDTWTADIPGTGADATIEYYVSVTDDQAVSATSPANAPTNVHSFNVGTDNEAPVIVHTPLINQALQQWPPTVQAQVTDNLGLASVSMSWSLNSVPQAAVPLANLGGDGYAADFPAVAVNIGDVVDYTITAVDGSAAANSSSTGPHSFEIIEAMGIVLILDDDASSKGILIKQDAETKSVITQPMDRPDSGKSISAAAMAAHLTAAGYVCTIEQAIGSNPATWTNYDFLISSSGRSNSPLTDVGYRTALVSYVQAGGKLIVEGGEVGYVASSFPGYPDVENFVTHTDTWFGDNSGALQGIAAQASHPIRTTPHALPNTIGVTYNANFGDQDSMRPLPNAYLVYGTTDEPLTGAGVLVYDDNAAPASAQIVFMANAYQQFTDQAVAAQLLENIATFLMADEGSTDACIAGIVALQESPNHAGSTITLNPGGLVYVTGNSGYYEFCGLFPGSYSVTVVGPAGYEGASGGATVAGGETANLDFELRQTFTYSACEDPTPNIAIPDNNPAGILSQHLVAVGGDVADVHVSVNITHTWRGDLIVELTSPMGTTVRLHNRTGSSADNLVTSYDDVTQESGPGNLDDFNGQAVTGNWTLKVSDNAGADTGTLNSWCLTLLVTQEGAVPVAVSGFTAENAEQGVELAWRVGDAGAIAGFDLLRRIDGGQPQLVNHDLLAAQAGQFRFVDPAADVPAGAMLRYELAAVDAQGARTIVAESAALKYEPSLPKVYVLDQNRPNPFNPKTTIEFALPQAGRTTIRIYDVAGRVVATLRDEMFNAGRHQVEWNGTDANGQGVSTGVYYYEIVSRNFRATKQMTLVK